MIYDPAEIDLEDMERIIIAFCSVEIGKETYSEPRCWRLANRWAVPHTGRRSHGHYFRRPRGAIQAEREGARAVPPDAWDDINFSHRFSRNWKRHRKTRWH